MNICTLRLRHKRDCALGLRLFLRIRIHNITPTRSPLNVKLLYLDCRKTGHVFMELATLHERHVLLNGGLRAKGKRAVIRLAAAYFESRERKS